MLLTCSSANFEFLKNVRVVVQHGILEGILLWSFPHYTSEINFDGTLQHFRF
jgi:hypothetical protein